MLHTYATIESLEPRPSVTRHFLGGYHLELTGTSFFPEVALVQWVLVSMDAVLAESILYCGTENPTALFPLTTHPNQTVAESRFLLGILFQCWCKLL